MSGALLASAGWVLDLVFFLILILTTAYGAYKGFVAGVCKMAGMVVTLVLSFALCVSFANFLELCFHMTTGIANGIANAIAKDEVYAAVIPEAVPGAEISEVLKGMNVGGFQRWMISGAFKDVEIPAGATPATLLGALLAKWISMVISFVLLVVLLRLAIFIIEKGFGALSERVTPLKKADQVLGLLLGLLKGLFLIFILLLICDWLPIDGLHRFIESSTVVGSVYRAEWFQNAISYAVSGRWFNDFIKK